MFCDPKALHVLQFYPSSAGDPWLTMEKKTTTPFLASFMTHEKVLKPKYKYRELW